MELAAQAAGTAYRAWASGMGIGNTTLGGSAGSPTHAPRRPSPAGRRAEDAPLKRKNRSSTGAGLHRPDRDGGGMAAVAGWIWRHDGAFLAAPRTMSRRWWTVHLHRGGADGGASLPVRESIVPLPRSYEIGYRIAAQELGQEPCCCWGCGWARQRLPGDVSDPAAACAVMDGMATFPRSY